jgi:DNA-binding CsgD family transcriptional regulator
MMSGAAGHAFVDGVKVWSNNASEADFLDWEEQIRLLSEIGDLISPDLTLEELIAAIYASVNQLMDAYQFGVGLYNEQEGTIVYKGTENNRRLPDAVIDAQLENRLGPWCIQHEQEIFINDFDLEYRKYVNAIPNPYVGSPPKAALYVPLFMDNKIAGLITVRTIHKNVYQKHHLYILKTLGQFVIRSLALAQQKLRPSVQSQAAEKSWHWRNTELLSAKSRSLLLRLTDRERDVLFQLISGPSIKIIAEKLFVSPGTVKTHTLNIYQKMDVNNRTSAVLKAIELGWLE